MSKAIDNITTQDAKDVVNILINKGKHVPSCKKPDDKEYRTTARNYLRYNKISLKEAKAQIFKTKLEKNAL